MPLSYQVKVVESFLIRDSDGDVVLSGWGRVNHLPNALQAETTACLQGVQAASSLGMGHLSWRLTL